MEIRKNVLREALNAGKPTLGTRVESTMPYITEIMASSGKFDYIEFDGEYSPYTEADLENICRAAELFYCSTVVKIDRQNFAFKAQRAIACGAHGLLFADVYDADDVKEILKAIRPSTPEGGVFGRPNRRTGINGQGRMAMQDYIRQTEDVVVMIMVEKTDTVKNLEEICKVPGVDYVAFGFSDYAMNAGLEPASSMDQINEVHRYVIDTAKKYNVGH